MPDAPPVDPLDDTPLTPHERRAVRLINALLDSASVDVIGAANWWPRTRSAIETAAAGAETFADLVSIAVEKMQIETLDATERRPSAQMITALTGELADPATFSEFRDLLGRDAVYFVALVQTQRAARRESAKAKADKPTAKPKVAAGAAGAEGMF